MKNYLSNWNHFKFLLFFFIPVLFGLGIFTFVYAKGGSYLTNDPKACANCHIMQSYYDGWIKSSHRSVAVCNDCHAPSSLIPKYYTKASNGFWHSYAFTLDTFEDNLKITPINYGIAEDSCKKCHLELTESISSQTNHYSTDCIHCHGAVGHPKN